MGRSAVKTAPATSPVAVKPKIAKKKAEPPRSPSPAPDADAEAKKPRRRSVKRLGRAALKLQRNSYRKPTFNPTQFRRIVAEVLREGGGAYRISARALEPLQEIVETQLHRIFLMTRYTCCDVNGRKSINLRNFNLAAKFVLQPEEMYTYPFDADTFDDDTTGPRLINGDFKKTHYPALNDCQRREPKKAGAAEGGGKLAVKKAGAAVAKKKGGAAAKKGKAAAAASGDGEESGSDSESEKSGDESK